MVKNSKWRSWTIVHSDHDEYSDPLEIDARYILHIDFIIIVCKFKFYIAIFSQPTSQNLILFIGFLILQLLLDK